MRKPSCLISWIQPGPAGGAWPAVAGKAQTELGIGADRRRSSRVTDISGKDRGGEQRVEFERFQWRFGGVVTTTPRFSAMSRNEFVIWRVLPSGGRNEIPSPQ